MIQPISIAHAAAAPADLGGQPALARALATGKPGAFHQVDLMHGSFGEQMGRAASEGDPLPADLLAQPGLPAAATEPGGPTRLGGHAEQSVEGQQELSPEQWLLAMIEQQLAEIQARDSARLGGVAVLPADVEPVSLEQAEAMLGGLLPLLPGQVAAEAAHQADPLEGLAERSRQGSVIEAALAEHGWQRAPIEAGMTSSALPRVARELNLTPAPPVAMTVPAAVEGLAEPPLEPLLNAAEPVEAGEPLTAAVGQTAPAQATDRALKLQAPEAKWGEQMLHALRENVDMQIQQKIQSATIRLDPPELGSLEILLSHESGRLNVQLSAANADVARLLQQSSDRLRQELVGQHFVQVNVQVGADSGGQQGQQRQRAALQGEEQLPMAARTEEQNQHPDSTRPRDVLITV
jgi:flagellar hook-length control protein FliK